MLTLKVSLPMETEYEINEMCGSWFHDYLNPEDKRKIYKLGLL